jgi:hypothetical protein
MRGVNEWLKGLPVLPYMALMALAPILGMSLAWVRRGFPSDAVELLVIVGVSSAVCSTLAREIRRRWDREQQERLQRP